MRRLLGKRTGLIRDVHINSADRDDPDIVSTQPQRANIETLLSGFEGELSFGAGGKGRTLTSSMARCVGEVVERYCSCFPAKDALRSGSYAELTDRGLNLVDLESLQLYDDKQYRRMSRLGVVERAFNENLELHWCEGTNLITGESVFIPAQLVYIWAATNHSTCFVGNSNGLAAGPSLQTALRSSILEVIERDSFMRTWFNETPTASVTPAELRQIVPLKRELENDVLEFHFFRFESDTDIHTIGCAGVSTVDSVPKFVLGGAASTNKSEAIQDALLEAAQGWQYAKYLAMRYTATEIDRDSITDFERNVAYFSHPDNFDEVRFLLDGKPTTTHGCDIDPELRAIIDHLSSKNYTPIAFDLTTRDIHEIGLTVTKVWIPELVSLSLPSFPPVLHPSLSGSAVDRLPHPYP